MISNRYISRTPCLFTRISSSYNILSLFYLVVISLGYPSLSRQYRLSSIRSLQNNYNLPPPLPIIDTGFKKTILKRVQREEKFRYPSRRVDGPRKGLHPGLAWKKKEEEKKERKREREKGRSKIGLTRSTETSIHPVRQVNGSRSFPFVGEYKSVYNTGQPVNNPAKILRPSRRTLARRFEEKILDR